LTPILLSLRVGVRWVGDEVFGARIDRLDRPTRNFGHEQRVDLDQRRIAVAAV